MEINSAPDLGTSVRLLFAAADRKGSVVERQIESAQARPRLRLLLVDPVARGRGLGTKLTDECVRFARACSYRGITLWTHSVLTAARHVYEQAGFRPTSSEKRKSFGRDVVSEYWDLKF